MNAIILAGGQSKRMKRDGYSTPKPLLPICGLPNVERTVLMLQEFGVREIFILCNYTHREEYAFLQTRYGCQIIYDDIHLNTLFTMRHVIDKFDDTFVIEGDVVLAKNIFFTAENSFYYIMQYPNSEPDAWRPVIKDGRIVEFEIGYSNHPCIFGISFWAHKDCPKVKSILHSFFTDENFNNKNLFWDDCFANALDKVDIKSHVIFSNDACEMNTGQEYGYAKEICEKYYQNCEKFFVDYDCSVLYHKPQWQLAYVQDSELCQQWHKTFIDYYNSRHAEEKAESNPVVFNKGEHPFMVMDTKSGVYVAYIDIAETPNYLLLRRLFVDEAYRKQGVGRQIMSTIKHYAKLSNKELRVNIYDEDAEQFYTTLGMSLYFKTFRYEGK